MNLYYRDGALEEPLWGEIERTLMNYFAYAGPKEWRATRRHG